MYEHFGGYKNINQIPLDATPVMDNMAKSSPFTIVSPLQLQHK